MISVSDACASVNKVRSVGLYCYVFQHAFEAKTTIPVQCAPLSMPSLGDSTFPRIGHRVLRCPRRCSYKMWWIDSPCSYLISIKIMASTFMNPPIQAFRGPPLTGNMLRVRAYCVMHMGQDAIDYLARFFIYQVCIGVELLVPFQCDVRFYLC